MGTDSIVNFIAIDERVATGGQPTRAQLEAAAREGFRAVVNLAPSNAENFALPGEDSIVQSLGMVYHHIPVEWSHPHPRQFEAFADTMNGLRDRKVLVHCAANFRVTAFFSLYAMRYLGWSAAQADQLISRIWTSRPDYRMDEVWKKFIADMRGTLESKGTP